MGVSHDLLIEINAEFNHKTVERILQRGIDHGMIYFKEQYVSMETLSPREGAAKLLSPEEREKDDGSPYLYIKFEDTYFSLWINAIEGRQGTYLFLGDNRPYTWKKLFIHSNRDVIYFDFMRYTRLLLVLCADFSISHLEAFTD